MSRRKSTQEVRARKLQDISYRNMNVFTTVESTEVN